MNHDQLDVLKRLETATESLNKTFHKRGKSVFGRYPVTFAIVVIFGVTMLSQGVKEILALIPFLHNHPVTTFFCGLFILIITGTVYKKLDH